MSEQIKVDLIWIDDNKKQVGARLSFNGQAGRSLDVLRDEFSKYSGRLSNANVTTKGLRAKPMHIIERKLLVRKTEYQIATYTLMHADTEVCKIYVEQNKVDVLNGGYLPFALMGGNVTVLAFDRWLNYRIDNLSRVYMNRVYMLRKVGRDREKILRDSSAISIIDNFWVHRSDVNTNWNELKIRRDKDIALANTALTGQISEAQYMTVAEDKTSLYTIKGAFKKGILNGFILKKEDNAEYEAAAFQLGRALDISVAQAVKQDNGIVGCRIFTSELHSMVHARDLLHMTDYDSEKGDDWHRAIYEYFIQQDRHDIARQLERLYIFNYLVINLDFHYENFGFLYDSSTFRLLEVAPAYDFNSAFAEYDNPEIFYTWIIERLPAFVRNHSDVTAHLKSKEFTDVLDNLPDISTGQKYCIHRRAKYLTRL